MRDKNDSSLLFSKVAKKYAEETGIHENQVARLIDEAPLIKAKVATLTQKEKDEIISRIPKSELERISKILSEVK